MDLMSTAQLLGNFGEFDLEQQTTVTGTGRSCRC